MSKGQLSPDKQRQEFLKQEFQERIGGGKGLQVETAQSALKAILK